jgi:hypothetical protein
LPQANRPRSVDPDSTDEILVELRLIEKRLREGEDFLRHRRESGLDPLNFDRWESAWISLLHQYESLFDQTRQASDAAQSLPEVADNQ